MFLEIWVLIFLYSMYVFILFRGVLCIYQVLPADSPAFSHTRRVPSRCTTHRPASRVWTSHRSTLQVPHYPVDSPTRGRNQLRLGTDLEITRLSLNKRRLHTFVLFVGIISSTPDLSLVSSLSWHVFKSRFQDKDECQIECTEINTLSSLLFLLMYNVLTDLKFSITKLLFILSHFVQLYDQRYF